jgi:hypothetical protein
LKSASIASCDPLCAARTQARSRRRDGRSRSAGRNRVAARSSADARARAEIILSTSAPDQEVPKWSPPHSGERYDPLPAFLRLPVRGWRKLSPRGRRILAALVVLAVAGIAVAWPYVQRDRRAGERERAAIAAQHRAASLRALVEDQRPRHELLSPAERARVRAAGGFEAAAAANAVATQLEAAIARDVRSRVAAGKLDGPLLETSCRPVAVRSAEGANYNCFALIARTDTGERVLEEGYRFSARAQLPRGTLAWCKENPRPLHPTSYVLSVPISPECR